jgi:hypothetical protein
LNNGRFFRQLAGAALPSHLRPWFAARFDGRDVEFERVTEQDALVMFDRQGLGPWQLWKNGHVASAGERPVVVRKAEHELLYPRQFQFSSDGHRVLGVLHRPRANLLAFYMLDLNTEPLAWKRAGGFESLIGEDFHRSSWCGLNILNRFNSIYVGDDGDLVLVGERRRRKAIRLDSSGHLTLVDADPRGGVGRSPLSFRPLRRRKGVPGQFRLRAANWPDGSRAILDSRGMLHLQGTAPGLPEITLVLTDRTIGGWTSDGLTFGWAFFHLHDPTAPAEYIYGLLRSFAARVR